MNSLMRLTLAMFLCYSTIFSACAADRFISLNGSGNKSGDSAENALDYSATLDSLQSAWDALSPDGTLYVLPGDYPMQTLRLESSGKSANGVKRLAGRVTDGKRPVFTGKWQKNDANNGINFIVIPDNASGWGIEDLEVRNCHIAILVGKTGNVSDGVIRNVWIREVREGVIFNGGATPTRPEVGTHNIFIENCSVVNFAKRGFRVRGGCYNLSFVNCLADAGGKEWATEPFHMGFSISGGGPGVYDHDITFIECTARNNYHDAGDRYWNADGFCAERNAYNLTYIGCIATDNTDGGWDDKSENPLLVDCFSARNKLNYRFWGAADKGVVILNSIAAFAVKRGGSGNIGGLWTGGTARVYSSSFVGNPRPVCINDYKVTPEQFKATDVLVKDSILTIPASDDPHMAVVKQDGNIVYSAAGEPGEAQAYADPSVGVKLERPGKDFDSVRHGATKGYNSGLSREQALERGRQLQPLIHKDGGKLPAGRIVIFEDKYASGWYLGGWKGGEMKLDKARGANGSAACLAAYGSNDRSAGAKFQTKRPGADINLRERQDAKWVLEFYVNAAGAKFGRLTFRAISLDPSVKTKDIDLPIDLSAGDADWHKVSIPLADCLATPDNDFSSFCGFFLRGLTPAGTPLYIDEIALVPLN